MTNLDFQIRELIRKGLSPDDARKTRALIAVTGVSLATAAAAAPKLDLTPHQIRYFRHGGLTFDHINQILEVSA